MHTYEETKKKAYMTICNGAMAMLGSSDHETCRQMLNSIIEACRLMLWAEDTQEAFEKGDLEGIINAKTKNGF